MHQEHINDFQPCEVCGDCETCGCSCDPTPYEIGEPDNLPREAQERAAESMRMKR